MDPEPSFLILNSSESFNYWLLLAGLLLLALLILSALLSGAEIAFFSLTEEDINKASESKERNQKMVVKLLEKPQKLQAAILIANNVINIMTVLIFVYIGEFLFEWVESVPLKFFLEVILITFLILLFGEVLPKVYATRNTLKFASFMALPISVTNAALTFISIPLMSLTNVIEGRLERKKSNISVEKLSQALELTSDDATTMDEQKMLEGIVSFGNTETGQIMIPRIDIFALANDEPYEKVISKIIKNGFSRNPVYNDNIDEIIGVLYAKDLLPHLNKKDFNWQKLLRKPYFVPENKKLDDLLKEFQEMKNHLAIVVDEYGGTSGIVTLEDVIEEIVGDISDEFDDDDLTYTKLGPNRFIFEGKTNLKDFYRIVDISETDSFEESKGESETVAGFVLEIYGKFPKKNETIKFNNFTFKIESMDKKRIKQVRITIDR